MPWAWAIRCRRRVVRLMLALKIASLARGYSGVRRELVDALVRLYNADVLPRIPSKGSVGASGDLAPLAHLSDRVVRRGRGRVRREDPERRRRPETRRARRASRSPPRKAWRCSTARRSPPRWRWWNLFAIDNLYATALVAGALSVDAAEGSASPFDARIHELRGHPGQIAAAAAYRELLADSPINSSHRECGKVQDPVLACAASRRSWAPAATRSRRRAPCCCARPMGSRTIRWSSSNEGGRSAEVLSGGNFHAEPVAFAADNLALAVAEIGALSERRIALLIDATLSGLPPFLVRDGGVNSGFMIAHVTAAALASENKLLAHPASVDSLPTSANQEDHVSMATFAARKLGDLCENTAIILAIELLAAAQGVDLRAPHLTSERLQRVMREIRARVPHYDIDRYLAPDIAAMTDAVNGGVIAAHAPAVHGA